MKIAERNQRAYFQRALVRVPGQHSVPDDYCILAMYKENALLNLYGAGRVSEHRKWRKFEGRQMFIPAWMNSSRILIDAQLITSAIDDKRLFQFREEHISTNRRLGGRDEQAMVAAGI